jgi:hypothetical protein
MRDISAPEPVQRYLLRALGATTAAVTRAQLRQQGELRTDPRSRRWYAFTANEVVDPVDVSFSWTARVRIAPWIHLRVDDGYARGRGTGRVKLQSAITIMSDAGTAELHAAALLRFLAESPWYPSALLPSTHLRWCAVDHTRATACLTDHGVTVEVEFRFDDAGDIVGMYAPARPRKTSTGYTLDAWEGHFIDYADRAGLRVPLHGEVGWYVDGAWACVWRGRIVEAHYQFD